jgi:hypothetical protein
MRIGTTATHTICFIACTLSGAAAGGSVLESATLYTEGSAATGHSIPFATTNNNDAVLMLYRGSTDLGTPSALGSWVYVDGVRNATDMFCLLNAGAVGAYNFTFTSAFALANFIRVVYKSAVTDPTVTTVTSPGTTEAGNMVFTASLSGATSGSTNYAFTLGGTATAGADYTSPLTSAMCSNGVTVSGGNFVVPTAVSSWTVTIPTTSDTLDEDSETIVLTIGGVASTGGTITDDDPLPSITITPSLTVDSGDSAVITITLGAVSGRITQARLVLADGTKTGGVDYTNVVTNGMLSDGVTIGGGVLSIPAGVGSFKLTIPTAA